jgi:hypothetical protein
MNSDERVDAHLLADLEYWQELSKLVGWTLLGFTYRWAATYVDSHGGTVYLTDLQRDDLVRVLTGPR